MEFRSTRFGKTVLGTAGVFAALAIWEGAIRLGIFPREDIPPATAVLRTLFDIVQTHWFWTAVGRTLLGAALGLGVAIAIGVPVGMLMGSVRLVGRGLRPTVDFMRSVPGVALIPLSLLVFGQNMQSDIFLVAFGCTWPILVQTMYGIQSIDDVALQTARAYGIWRPGRIRHVIIPATMPYIATGLRICASIALIIAVTAELVTGTPGLGSEMVFYQGAARINELYALILISGILGLAIQVCFAMFERRFLHWHQSQRPSVPA